MVVADAGRDRPMRGGEEIICRPDGLFGFKVLNPATGKRHGAFDYEAVRQVEQEAEEAERLRLYYVAMTRAVDRLLISGSIDPGRGQEARTPMGWVLDRLGSVAIDDVGDEPVVVEHGQARLLLHVDRYRPEPETAPVDAGGSGGGTAFAFHGAGGGACGGGRGAAAPRAARHPTHLRAPPALVQRARDVRAVLREVLRALCRRHARAAPRARARCTRRRLGGARVAREHRPCGSLCPRRPGGAAACATEEELARIEGFLAAYCDSQLAARLSTLDGARREQSFSFEHDGVVLHGFIDVLHLGERALVVDFKTNALEGESAERVVEEDDRLQQLVYALACLRAGASEVEVVYQFLEQPDDPVVTVFTAADAQQLEEELSAAIASIRSGTFVPTPSEWACSDCPALDVVCAGTRLRTAVGA